jgi:Na+/pantothenate symporter
VNALVAAVTPVALIVILIVMLAIGALQAVFLAPWAVAYRDLSRNAEPEHPPVF